jgi:hypothetical protein
MKDGLQIFILWFKRDISFSFFAHEEGFLSVRLNCHNFKNEINL